MGRRCREGEGEGHPALFPAHGLGWRRLLGATKVGGLFTKINELMK